MEEKIDRRMWSITAQGFFECIFELEKSKVIRSSVRELQMSLKTLGIYPARDLSQWFTPEPPDVFFTYDSRQQYQDIHEIVWKTFAFAAKELQRHRPELTSKELLPFISNGIRLWVDFMFIDQSARDISQELDALPQLLNTVKVHCVVGETPLERAWCCYEIALFNQSHMSDDQKDLVSFIAPFRTIYHGWEHVLVTEAKDKRYIEERIINNFPKGFEGFQRIMDEANTIAILQLTEGSIKYTDASMDNLSKVVEHWFDRFLLKLR